MTDRDGYALSPDEVRRAHQVQHLQRLGARGVESLVGMLTDQSWAVRRAVVAALARVGQPAVAPLVEVLTGCRDDETRIAAAVDALSASSAEVADALEPMLTSDDAAVVSDAVQVLGRRGAREAAARLAALTEHPDDNVAVAAIEALGRIGGRAAVEALVSCVQSGNFFRVFPAIDVLGRSGDPRAVEPLAALLDDPHYALEAGRALGRTGLRRAARPLARMLSRGGGAHVRVAALAFIELLDRTIERHGSAEVIEAELRSQVGEGTVRHLSGALREADSTERVALARVLGALGRPEAAPSLDQLLTREGKVAAAAGTALARLGRASELRLHQRLIEADSARRLVLLPLVTDAEAWHEVAACLDDESPDVRAAAAETLARIGAADAVPSLFPRLGDPDPRVGQAAESAICALGGSQTEALASTAARSPSARVRRAALRILGYGGFGAAFSVLQAAIEDPDPRVRDAAVQGLPFIDDPRASDTLLELAQRPDPRVRAAAMRALGHAASGPRIAARLLGGLGDPDPWVRYYACKTVGGLGLEAAVAPLARLLGDPAGQVRVAAIEALSHLESAGALEAILEAARAEDPDVRRAALVGLGIGKQPRALPALLEAARTGDAATRLVAVSSLAWFDAPEVLTALGQAAGDPDESVRAAAIGFLAAQPDAEATRILLDRLGRPELRARIREALAVPSSGRVPVILEALEDADDDRAARLTEVLARQRGQTALDALLRASESRNPAARRAACVALAELDDPRAVTAVAELLEQDPDDQVRRVCSAALAR